MQNVDLTKSHLKHIIYNSRNVRPIPYLPSCPEGTLFAEGRRKGAS